MAETLARKSNLEKLKEAQSKTTTSGFKYWKPQKNGKYLIRFLPNPDPNGIFYKGALQHKVGENYVFCPKTEGKPCPICEKYNKLWKIETPASIKLAREIKPKEQYLYNIVVRQEGEKVNETPDKVFVYMAGKKLHGPPSISLSFSLATVLPRRLTYRVSFNTETASSSNIQ